MADSTRFPVNQGNVTGDKTVVERFISGDFEPQKIGNEYTIKENSSIEVTSDSIMRIKMWRGYEIVREIPAKSGESDIYLVRKDGENRVLKFYRKGFEPKISVLERVKELSNKYPEYFIQVFEFGFDKETNRWYEIQEFAQLGNLTDFATSKKLTESELKSIIHQLNEGLNLLHSNGIVHRDIKPSNILVRSANPINVVFTDYGISSLLEGDASKKFTTIKGTFIYCAPEAFTGIVGREADYWSLGMIIYELITGANPFSNLSYQTVIYTLTVKDVAIPKLGNRFEDLLRGLLTKDPKSRWGYSEIKRWLSGENVPVMPTSTRGIDLSNQGIRTRDTYSDNKPANITSGYKFMGKTYYDMFSLSYAFLQDAQSFEMAKRHITKGYLRNWLESLNDFDQISFLEELIESSRDADEMVIKFAYRYHRDLPLVLYGRVIEKEYLLNLIIEASAGNLSEFDYRIYQLIKTGRLSELLLLYSSITNSNVTEIQNLLSNFTVFDKKGLFEHFIKLLINYRYALEQNQRTYLNPFEKLDYNRIFNLSRDKLDILVQIRYDENMIFFAEKSLSTREIQEEFLKAVTSNQFLSGQNEQSSILSILFVPEIQRVIEEINPRIKTEVDFLLKAFNLLSPSKDVEKLLEKERILRDVSKEQDIVINVFIKTSPNLKHTVTFDRASSGKYFRLAEQESRDSLKIHILTSFTELGKDFSHQVEEIRNSIFIVSRIEDNEIRMAKGFLAYPNVLFFDITHSEFFMLLLETLARKQAIKQAISRKLNELQKALESFLEEVRKYSSDIYVFKSKVNTLSITERILKKLKEVAVEPVSNQEDVQNILEQIASEVFCEVLADFSPQDTLRTYLSFLDRISQVERSELPKSMTTFQEDFNRLVKDSTEAFLNSLLKSKKVRYSFDRMLLNEPSLRELKRIKKKAVLAGITILLLSVFITPLPATLFLAGSGIVFVVTASAARVGSRQANEYRLSSFDKYTKRVTALIDSHAGEISNRLLSILRNYEEKLKSSVQQTLSLLDTVKNM